MAKRKKSNAPAGYALLTAAGELGADLRPAYRVLMHLPDTRKDTAAWLCERAVAGDPAVGAYLETAGGAGWDDWDTRREVVRLLDEHHPRLARRVTDTSLFVLKSDEGYWAGWGFTEERRFARFYLDTHQCCLDLAAIRERGKRAVPVFMESEELWRGLGPTPAPGARDPWGALERCRVVPGCAWVPIPPAVRKELETHIFLEGHIEEEPEPFRETMRMAARFGHPLYTVYADLSARQGWDPAFREELRQLDFYHARFRDPPGEVPTLQPMEGPYKVLCGPAGFWTGSGWSPNLAEAKSFPAWNRDVDEEYESARREATERAGVPVADTRLGAHLSWREVPTRQPAARPRRRSPRSKK